MYRLIYAIPLWIIVLLARTVFILLGYIMVPLALLFKAYRIDPNTKGHGNNGDPIYLFTWPVMKPWNNLEDGFYCKTYFDHGFILTSLRWSCVRNPANGLRYMPLFSVKIVPSKVNYIGRIEGFDIAKNPDDNEREYLINRFDTKVPQWFFAWQGLYSNFYWQFKIGDNLRRFWIGWAIYPTDIYGVTEYRKKGAGFKTQWKKIR